jgi:hypothetical protein
MSISEKDIKKLWGLAAGRCSWPGCDDECVRFLGIADSTIIGEMAHIIARSPMGPRGADLGGSDSYENLILLCPTHHTLVDKAPEHFPAETLLAWKKAHERDVEKTFAGRVHKDKRTLCEAIKRLLIENHRVWSTYGPESEVAITNPCSSIVTIWILRKLDTIVPNNRRIVSLIERNQTLFSLGEYEICRDFIEHAEGFEISCYQPQDSTPRFPMAFQEVIDRNV